MKQLIAGLIIGAIAASGGTAVAAKIDDRATLPEGGRIIVELPTNMAEDELCLHRRIKRVFNAQGGQVRTKSKLVIRDLHADKCDDWQERRNTIEWKRMNDYRESQGWDRWDDR